ncbi:MAG: iron-sulfur cluster co-chaperone HscB C-terminal domain-containing protein [Chitinophagaceae bacterium]
MKQQYFQLSRKYHPDFVSNGTDEEKEEALQTSSLVNKAYKIFNNQDETIKYVLQLKELLIEEEKFALPNDFLMEMMELNEQLMDAKMEDDKEAIENCQLLIANWQNKVYEPVKEIVESNIFSDIPQEKLLQVKEYYFKKKYISRILDSTK